MIHSLPSPEPFVILAMPRTGTHYLEALLNDHPNILSNGELLNSYDENWPDKDRLRHSDRELLELAYMRYPPAKKKVTHVGCKINEPQFYERPGFFDELARWQGLKVILLTRNTLESLRSLVQARQTGQWLKFSPDRNEPPSVSLSVNECEAYFKAADDFHARVKDAFDPSKLLMIEYQDLLLKPSACLAAVLAFLGAPAHRFSNRATIQRQETRSLARSLRNFVELRRHFAGGPYAKFFELDDASAPQG
ncbi:MULTISPECIES: sulfotransferase [Rhizobium]|uniref:Nodulation protein H n=5 Tax=Rhizobium TaxID=379 RepID=NODH_RHITR|nr:MULTISPECIES: sulfotransferase [Rhizobium]P52994.1 RecName: Full=Nodulation protein H [Rhizobium tropici]AAB08982.1 NodH [Rhizobium leucaenae USDA 9039]AFJ42556.1 NodH [Rhizobium tropici]AGB73540.1 sulfotransferase NodH [Rhizobium tropici CIAT 899]AYG70459.1 nodulation protein H [Rhizobium sp. CCGE531]AYG76914.1 nodulation protein H [Rhizobium sp. CCGE532]